MKQRLLVVHALPGHGTAVIPAIAAALGPERSFFWVHDYAAICAGRNLLRNDVVFCGAPPDDSMACRICVHGDRRGAYRAGVRDLFAAVAFDVVVPSPVALEVWRQAAADLPVRSLRVHAGTEPMPGAAGSASIPLAAGSARAGPIRVAFVGEPSASTGWPLFADLVRRARAAGDCAFHHFAGADPDHPAALRDALAGEDIDLVLVPAPWPNPSGFVAEAALAAGADVVTLAASGAAAEAVRRHRRGVVLAAGADVLRFFLDGHAVAYVRAQRATPRSRAALAALATTATIDLARDGPPDLDGLATADPDLVVLAGTAVIPPSLDGPIRRFALPEGAASIRLVSRHVTPARQDPHGMDFRRLGVAVRRLELDGRPVPHGHPSRRRGWHGVDDGDELQWTSGDATLEVGGARSLTLELAPLLRYQRCAPAAPAPLVTDPLQTK